MNRQAKKYHKLEAFFSHQIRSTIALGLAILMLNGCALVGLPMSLPSRVPIETGKLYEFGERFGAGNGPTAQFIAPNAPGWTISKIYHKKHKELKIEIPDLGQIGYLRAAIFSLDSFAGAGEPSPIEIASVRNVQLLHDERMNRVYKKLTENHGLRHHFEGEIVDFMGFKCSRTHRTKNWRGPDNNDYFVSIFCPVFVGDHSGSIGAFYHYRFPAQRIPVDVKNALPFIQQDMAPYEAAMQSVVYDNIRFLYPLTQKVPEKYAHISTDAIEEQGFISRSFVALKPRQNSLFGSLVPLKPGQTYLFGNPRSSDQLTNSFSITLPQSIAGEGWFYDVLEAKLGHLYVQPPGSNLIEGLDWTINLRRVKPEFVPFPHTPEFLASFLDVEKRYEQHVIWAKESGNHADYSLATLPEGFGAFSGLRCTSAYLADGTTSSVSWYFSYRYRCSLLIGGVARTMHFTIGYRHNFKDKTASSAEKEIGEARMAEEMRRHLPFFFDHLKPLYPITQKVPESMGSKVDPSLAVTRPDASTVPTKSDPVQRSIDALVGAASLLKGGDSHSNYPCNGKETCAGDTAEGTLKRPGGLGVNEDVNANPELPTQPRADLMMTSTEKPRLIWAARRANVRRKATSADTNRSALIPKQTKTRLGIGQISWVTTRKIPPDNLFS